MMDYRNLVSLYGEDQAFTMLRVMEQMARIQAQMGDIFDDSDDEKQLRLIDALTVITRKKYLN